MQTDEPEFELVSNTLDTPSLMTPNIMSHAHAQKPIFASANADASSDSRHSHETDSSATTTTTATNSAASSADVKVHKIEDELKNSVSEPRRPTPSPFQKMSSGSGFALSKPSAMIVNDDGVTVEIPSTADVGERCAIVSHLRRSRSGCQGARSADEHQSVHLPSENVDERSE